MKTSVWIALGIVVCVVGFFSYGTLVRAPQASASDASSPLIREQEARQRSLPVLVTPLRREAHRRFINLKGTTEPDRTVIVRSETTGPVVSAAVDEGETVKRGALLCKLDVAARNARIAEAEAAVRSAELDYGAARQLADKGWASEGQAASRKAALDSARASLDAAKIELKNTDIRAPFSGVFETRDAEQGDFLTLGSACGTLVDLDPIRIAVDASETFAGQVALDTPVEVRLSNGDRFEGTISYVARTADTATRTFRVVAEAPNPEAAIPAGLSASLFVAIGDVEATPISPALLTLDDSGQLGVRHVDGENRVQFSNVEVIDEAEGRMWITGLPSPALVLLPGQEYLKNGAEVVPEFAEAPTR